MPTRLPASAKLAMSAGPSPSAGPLMDACAACAAAQVIAAAAGPPWDSGGFAALLEQARTALKVGTVTGVTVERGPAVTAGAALCHLKD